MASKNNRDQDLEQALQELEATAKELEANAKQLPCRLKDIDEDIAGFIASVSGKDINDINLCNPSLRDLLRLMGSPTDDPAAIIRAFLRLENGEPVLSTETIDKIPYDKIIPLYAEIKVYLYLAVKQFQESSAGKKMQAASLIPGRASN